MRTKALKYHFALGRSLDLEGIDRDAKDHKCPRHVLWQINQQLDGVVIHRPGQSSILPVDKMRAKIIGHPENWALARVLASKLTSEDLIFCSGEDVGIPVATLCGNKRWSLCEPPQASRPKIAVFIHSIDRPRGWAALKLFSASDRIDLFVTNAQTQVDFLRSYLRLSETRIYKILEQTDTAFFTPGLVSPDKARPIIASVGLEYRDYRTLANVTQDLDVDVKISGFSQDAPTLAKLFPKTMPVNMSRKFYEWQDLVQLYRDADLVVLNLLENKATAGVTTLLEAMSCRRPVVVTQTKGLSDYLQVPGTVTCVQPGDSAGLRQAIVNLLQNPQKAEEQAQRGYELVIKQHNSEQYAEALARRLMKEGNPHAG